ncbi:MAG: DUF11 domain-containing protein [Caldilineae bacterium]|nr:DUF11 domain-containing protein [Caldilineae bacterium]
MSTRERLNRSRPTKSLGLALALLATFWLGGTVVEAMRIDDGAPPRRIDSELPAAPDAAVTLGNLVFRDLDNDGRYEPGDGELGIPTVLLNLYRDDGASAGTLDGGDTQLASGNTVGGGLYAFSGLADGNYLVEVDPLNFDPGAPLSGLVTSSGNDPAPDPDDDVNDDDNGRNVLGFGVASGAITLASGTEPTTDGDADADTNLSLDFGFTCQLCVGDRIFEDLDDDGVFDALDEVGIANVEVSLYRDADADGQRSAGDALVDSTQTDADGRYTFCGLSAGDYVVEVVAANFQTGAALAGFRSSAGNDPAPDPDDDVDDDDNGAAVTGFGVATRALTLRCGSEPDKPDDGDGTDSNLTVDLGFVPTLTLGDLIFKDLNFDGVFDAGDGDIGLPLVLLNLYRDSNSDGRLSAGDTLLTSTNSQGNGSYRFTGLEPGDYLVEVDPSNFGPGGALVGLLSSGANEVGGLAPDPDDDVDGDDNGYAVSGFGVATRALTLVRRGEPITDGDGDSDTNLTLDLGFVCNLCLGDRIFRDDDNDGIFDAGTESGIDAVTVDLYRDADADGVLSAGDVFLRDTQTGPDGDYRFCGLTAGDYIVVIDPSEFQPGGSLLGLVSSSGNDPATDPDDDVDNDDNGAAIDLGAGLLIATRAVSLGCGQEPDKLADGDGVDGNLTVDLGLTPAAPSLRLDKTVYLGQDAGASCPGGELVSDFNGTAITYCFAVTNTGDTYLDGLAIADPALGITLAAMTPLGAPSFPLAPGATATWYYEATIAGDLLNTAGAAANPTDDQGRDLPGLSNPTDADTAEVQGIVPGTPGIEILKSADPTTVYAGATVVYTYRVVNSGETVLDGIAPTDDQCGPLAYQSGDDDLDGLLDIGETWTYTCSAVLSVDTLNTATVSGQPTGDQGTPIPGLSPVSDSDTATVDVIRPSIRLLKTALPTQTTPGGSVTFSFIVSNPGDDPLANVALSDDTCSPISPLIAGDVNGNGLLDPSETWVYSCTTTVAGDTLNRADVTGDDSLGNPVTDADTAFVDVIVAGMDITKTADATVVYDASLVTYRYTAVNTGEDPLSNVQVSDDTCAPLSFDGGDANNNGLLEVGETWTFSCSQVLTADTTNVATGTAEDPLGNPVTPDEAVATVDVIHPAIEVVKTASPTVILSGQSVIYRYRVSNPGDDPLSNVSLSDDTCGPVSGPQPGDDANGNGQLDPGEIWQYACGGAPTVDTTNTVIASGDDSLGNPVDDTDTAFVDVVRPSIALVKTASEPIVYPGTTVNYTLEATNDGDVSLAAVSPSDDSCSPVTGPDPAGDANSNGLLDPGETWTYGCSAVLNVDLTNTATVQANPVDSAGTDLPGLPEVSDSDTADVNVIDPSIGLVKTVDQPQVAPGTTVVWRFEATNTGDDPLTNVALSDDTCGPPSGPDPAGDTNGNGLMDPGETWVWTCSDVVDVDTVNLATVTADDSLGNPVTDADMALVDVQDVLLSLTKSVDQPVIYAGALVLYRYEVTNLGSDPATNVVVTDDRCALVGFLGGDANSDGRLDPSETWSYACQAILNQDTVNMAEVTGEDLLGNPLAPDMAMAEVDVINPAIRVEKSADPAVTLSGGTVTYGYRVSNPGDDPLANVSLSDDTCSPVSGPTSGDGNSNGLLDPGEVWSYGCTTTVAVDTTNTATVGGDDSLGNPVTGADSAFVDVVAPALRIEKTVTLGGMCPGADSLAAEAGSGVTYCYRVTNTGDTYLSSLQVTDDVLGAVCTIAGPLAPGATQGCIATATASVDVTNTGTVTGNPTDGLGNDLPGLPDPTDADQAALDVVAPAIDVQKTVYQGHDAGASCPGGELVSKFIGNPITYCFAVTNTGDTYLDSVALLDLDLGVSEAQATLLGVPSFPLAPGASATWYYETSIAGDLLNTVSARANPVDPAGNDLPGLTNPSDVDTAEVAGLVPGTPRVDLVKTADVSTVYPGSPVVYTYAVSNLGTTILANVALGDDRCGPISGLIDGDTNGNGLLDPGETWRYSCGQALASDTTNTGTVTATPSDADGDPIPGQPPVGDTDTATVDVINPRLAIVKRAIPDRVRPGEPVHFVFIVSNPGDDPLANVGLSDDTCSPVVGPQAGGDANANGLLDPGETWIFDCQANPTQDHRNVATATGEDSLGGPVQASDEAFVDVVIVGLDIEKQADADTVYDASLVTYRYTVRNTGSEPASNVGVSDDRCAPVSGPDPAGDANTNGLLDPGEVWTYACSQVLTEDTTNIATVVAEDPLGNPVEPDQSMQRVDVIHPAIRVVKSASPNVILSGAPVVYRYVVTNPGDDPLSGVGLSDDTCGPVSGPQAGGDANADGLLDPGETWIFACSAAPLVDTTNTVLASGQDSLGGPVQDQDSAFVDVVAPSVLLQKDASAPIVYAGDLVTYAILASNTGDVALDPVSVSDDRCSPLTGPDPAGDTTANGLLDPGETWAYACTRAVDADLVNTASATFNPVDDNGNDLPGLPDVGDEASAAVDAIDPSVQLVKSVDPSVIAPGDPVVYTFELSNTGDDPLSNVSVGDDTCSPVTGPDPAGDLNANGLLDPGETWIYRCSARPTSDTVNVATGGGDDSLGNPVSDSDTALVDALDIDLTLEKSVDRPTIDPGDLVVYTYRVGNVGGAAAYNVVVSDDRCTPITGPDPSGDTNANGLLDPGEIWVYGCSTVLNDDTVNVATVTGEDALGNPQAPDSAMAEVDVIRPAIQVVKRVDPVVTISGGAVTYRYDVTNPGDDPLASVALSDDTCSPVAGPLPAGDLDSDGLLDPGETWQYSCTTSVAGDTLNTVVASGRDSLGRSVTDRDSAFVDVVAPAIRIQKTVSTGGQCPGVERLSILPGTVVGYCYTVTNAGDTYLSDIAVTDNILGAVCTLAGPLAPGAMQTCMRTASPSDDVTNVGRAVGNPTDVNGRDLPGIPSPSAEDDAAVVLVRPAVEIQKTVYAGHDAGAGCPGSELVLGAAGDPLTWCFAVRNSGDTYLANLAILDLDLGISLAQMTLASGSLPLAPGASATWYFEGSLLQSRVNRAQVGANPSDAAGVDLPGLPNVFDDDVAEVVRTSCIGDRIFYDLDNDGRFEPETGEVGLNNVLVNLYRDDGSVPGVLDATDTRIGSMLTVNGGQYRFCLLRDGEYIVQVDATNFLPGGPLPLAVSSFGGGPPTDPDDDVDGDDNGEADALGGVSTFAVSIAAGTEPVAEDGDPDSNLTLDLGFVGTGRLGDQVWLDADGNGQPDPGEGIPGVLVRLTGTVNGMPFVYTTTTGPDGAYLFENLLGGTYRVTIVTSTLPLGLAPSYDLDGLQTPNTAQVELLSGEVTLLVDFAYRPSLAAGTSRAKLFYDPQDGEDVYVNQRGPDLLPTLRVYGQTAVCDPEASGAGNLPVTAGANSAIDPATGLVPEDPAYTDPEGPFSPLSPEAPESDYVTWNPAWISERLGDSRLMAGWGCANGLDEVSAGSNIRAGGVNASEKVWLRHWYEPTHLDKDLNADGCLTDLRGAPDGGPDGIPDAPMNPTPSGTDEWYPAIMTELTYLLVENNPLPQPDPLPSQLHRSAPRPTCGAPGPGTRIVFPVGTALTETAANAPAVGYGLTSLDVDFDGVNDMVTVSDEANLPALIGGTRIDFDGDGLVDVLDGDRSPGAGALSCDELAVFHTDAVTIGLGETAQFLDHFVRVAAVTNSGAVLQIVYSGDLQPRTVQQVLVGNGATALAGDIGPAQLIAPGGSNLGSVPRGPWFVHVLDSDPDADTAIVILGRGLGAPCASMEDGPNRSNLRPGSPYFLKRFYVDGHEYNVTAIMSCDTGGFQYLSLRSPLPKVRVTIEQHSVRLQAQLPTASLPLPPPFNHEHTLLEDVAAPEGFESCSLSTAGPPPVDRPDILYMGGPVGPVPPVLGEADADGYVGRDPNRPVGPYTDTLASRWFYVLEDVNPGFVGQLREKYGAVNSSDPSCPTPLSAPDAFFYNEQVLAAPNHFTEFHLPQLDDPTDPGGDVLCDPDGYYVTTSLVDPNARVRRWRMPDAGVPAQVPPGPPDLLADYGGFDPVSGSYGAPRRASFEFDPDTPEKLVADGDGVRLYGGYLPCADADCGGGAAARPSILYGAGDVRALADPLSGAPVEVLPYTDPFAPFNPQHPDAPRSDSLTFNPAFLSEYQNSGEDLASLYSQIANDGQNALQKVYHRMWYQPEYITKLRQADDCGEDIAFPALMQEYSFLALDTTANPRAMPPGTSRLAFPMATRADELPLPGTNPPDAAFGYGLTTFDADFDGQPEAVTIHSEATLNARLDAAWQAVVPQLPGLPLPAPPGPLLDFDGDGSAADDLDADCVALNGNEMVVFALESIVLDRDAATTSIGSNVMFLDHMASVTNVTGGSFPRAQFSIRYTGGGPASAVPQAVPGGLISLDVGDAVVVDHLGGGLRRVRPGQDNLGGLDGAWFLFVEDVSSDGDLVVVTVGRALGASHSAIDDGNGNHDLTPGDPWYLKRFYVDGHEYNVVALMTRTAPGADPLDPAECNGDFAFITIRTPVPKGRLAGSQYNFQDSLFQQGYFLDGLPAQMSVMPPFNVDHTIRVDVERIEPGDFNNPDAFTECNGPIRAAGPLTETILAEEREPRRATELRETYSISGTLGTRPAWETHQAVAAADGFTELRLPRDQQYLLTSSWRSPFNRLAFYGCTALEPGPYTEDDPPPLGQVDLQVVSECWRPGILPDADTGNPPYVGPRLGGDYGNLPGPVVVIPPPPPPLTGSDLRLVKRALTATPVAGTQFAYLIEVFNDGPDPAAQVIVRDTLPAGLSYASDTTGGACSLTGTLPDAITCSFSNLAVGDSILFAVLAFVDPGVAPGTPMVNTASVELGGSTVLSLADGEPVAPLGAGDPNPANNRGSATVFIVAEADLGLSNQATTPDPVVAGETFSSRFRVGNAGPSDAPGLRMTVEIPAGTTYAGSQGAACSGVPMGGRGTLTCLRDRLPLGGEAELELLLRVDPSVDPGTLLRPTLQVSAPGSTDPSPADNLAGGQTTSIAEADLSIEKLGPATVRPGERFDWTITVRNAGPSDARGVSLIESLPPELRLVAAEGVSCSEAPPSTQTCLLGRLPAGAERRIRLTVELSETVADGATLGGTTRLVSDTTERDAGNNETSGSRVTVRREADLSLAVVAPASASAGAETDWQLRLQNAGPTGAAGLSAEATLPAGLSFVDRADGCAETAPGSGRVVCQLGDLALGGVASQTIRTRLDATLADGSRLELSATLHATSFDPNPANDSASAVVTVKRQADLVVALEGVDSPAVAGRPLGFAMTLSNRGPSPAEGVVLTSRLPAGVRYLSDDGGCSLADGKLSCVIGSLPAGQAPRRIAVRLDLDPALPDGTVLSLRAAASTATRETQPADNAAASAVRVGALADLRLESQPGLVEALAGTSLRQVHRLTNAGPSAARELMLTDRLPAGLRPRSLPAGCALEADRLRCALGDLAPGQSLELGLDLDLDASLADGLHLTSEAGAVSAAPDPDPASARSRRDITISTEADLSLTKDGPDAVEPGQPVSYRLRLANAGPSDAQDLRLVDRLPAGLSFKLASSAGCVERAGLIDCALGGLAAGQQVELWVEATASADLADGAQLVNTAELGSATVDPNAANDRDAKTTTVTLADAADLALTLQASEPAPAAGTELTLRALASNNGPRPAPNTRLRLTLPAGLRYVGDAAGCTLESESQLGCAFGHAGVGVAAQRELRVALAADAARRPLAPGGAGRCGRRPPGHEPGQRPGRGRADRGSRRADLALSLAATPGGRPGPGRRWLALRPGRCATWATLGPAAFSGRAQLSLRLPAGARYRSDDAGCDVSGLPLLVCQLPALDRTPRRPCRSRSS